LLLELLLLELLEELELELLLDDELLLELLELELLLLDESLFTSTSASSSALTWASHWLFMSTASTWALLLLDELLELLELDEELLLEDELLLELELLDEELLLDESLWASASASVTAPIWAKL